MRWSTPEFLSMNWSGCCALPPTACHNDGRESVITQCAVMTGLPGDDPADLPLWQGLADALLTKNGEFRRYQSR